jgi:hypothetical protein
VRYYLISYSYRPPAGGTYETMTISDMHPFELIGEFNKIWPSDGHVLLAFWPLNEGEYTKYANYYGFTGRSNIEYHRRHVK